ncbi:MAG: DUF2219 family protein [Alphaproteobacteria bacterium]|nr:MAG: DUF2219 family protein [Alphaproteobacteria bacterium]
MFRMLLPALAALLTLTTPLAAQERAFLGWGRLFTNDFFGDGQDRWHTGSWTASVLRGPEGTADLPERFGALMEYRFAAKILAPANLVTPAPGDRPYAGSLSFGAFSHFRQAGTEFSLGASLVAVGPMTGLDSFHALAHNALGMTPPSAAVRAAQLPNAFYPTLSAEIARPLALGGEAAVIRPFIGARAGDESFVRVGADLLIGPNFTRGVLARDETTGLPYQTLAGAGGRGFSFLLGADTARVFSSAYLPASRGYRLTPARNRLRAGVNWQGEHLSLFYGAAWLGPEFSAQPGGQIVGALQIRMSF